MYYNEPTKEVLREARLFILSELDTAKQEKIRTVHQWFDETKGKIDKKLAKRKAGYERLKRIKTSEIRSNAKDAESAKSQIEKLGKKFDTAIKWAERQAKYAKTKLTLRKALKLKSIRYGKAAAIGAGVAAVGGAAAVGIAKAIKKSKK
jgi:Skp family chaperone for outer membrane proteins